MEKSKNYDAARKELKQINVKMVDELEADYQDTIRLLKYSKDVVDPKTYN